MRFHLGALLPGHEAIWYFLLPRLVFAKAERNRRDCVLINDTGGTVLPAGQLQKKRSSPVLMAIRLSCQPLVPCVAGVQFSFIGVIQEFSAYVKNHSYRFPLFLSACGLNPLPATSAPDRIMRLPSVTPSPSATPSPDYIASRTSAAICNLCKTFSLPMISIDSNKGGLTLCPVIATRRMPKT